MSDMDVGTARITDAVARMFIGGDACLRNSRWTGRRVDIISIGGGGEITIAEPRVRIFWGSAEYRDRADRFYLPLPTVSQGYLPGADQCGIITDGFDCLR